MLDFCPMDFFCCSWCLLLKDTPSLQEGPRASTARLRSCVEVGPGEKPWWTWRMPPRGKGALSAQTGLITFNYKTRQEYSTRRNIHTHTQLQTHTHTHTHLNIYIYISHTHTYIYTRMYDYIWLCMIITHLINMYDYVCIYHTYMYRHHIWKQPGLSTIAGRMYIHLIQQGSSKLSFT